MAWKQYFLYMMTNRWKNVLYTGMTNSLERRVAEHKSGTVPGFTKKYNCDRLVYYEEYAEITELIDREKQIKRWSRKKKDALIAQMNPQWDDLAAEWYLDRVLPSEVEGSSTDSPEAGDPSTSLGMTPKEMQ